MTTMKNRYTPYLSKKGNPITRNVGNLLAKAMQMAVVPNGDGDYVVYSTSGGIYGATVSETSEVMEGATRHSYACTCTCDYGLSHEESGSVTCSHTIAAVRAHLGRSIKLYATPPQTAESRKTHRPVAYLGDSVWAAL